MPTNVQTSDKILEIVNLSVSFDGFKAIDSLNLSINKNELRVIIGPNGAGKTTLLDIICGKTKSSHGHVYFKDKDLTKINEHEIVRLGIGRKFQTPSVYEDLTVFENLEISLPNMHGISQSLFYKNTPEIFNEINKVASQTFLIDKLGMRAGQISHGQKQWLEIGMLLLQDPNLLLLDEPVAGMSPKEREQTGELLKDIAVGRSVIVIEHDMDFVKSIADKVTVLHQGKMLSEGNVDDIQSDPRVIDVYLGH